MSLNHFFPTPYPHWYFPVAFCDVVLAWQPGDICFQDLLHELAAFNGFFFFLSEKGQRVTEIILKVFFVFK